MYTVERLETKFNVHRKDVQILRTVLPTVVPMEIKVPLAEMEYQDQDWEIYKDFAMSFFIHALFIIYLS